MSLKLHPLLVDVGIAAVLAAAMLFELAVDTDTDADVTAAGIVVILLAVLPVALWRRHHPGWALAGSMLALAPLQTVLPIYQTIPFPSMAAGFSLALVVPCRRIVQVGLVVAPAVLLNLAVVSEHSIVSFETLKNLAFVAFPLALGNSVRERRAHLAALIERAETAERTRDEEARRRVDEERLRIARDLHDMVAHSLVAINVQAGVAAHVQDPDPETNRQIFRDIKQVSGEALADLRTTLGVLRAGDVEAPVAPTPGLEQVADLVGVLGTSGVEVELDLDDDTRTVTGTAGATAYRIVQEALTNVMRHAGPTRARVTLRRTGATLRLEIENDPPSTERHPSPGSGHGLQGMRERAVALGGTLHAGPTATGGWLVCAELPLPVAPHQDLATEREPEPAAQRETSLR